MTTATMPVMEHKSLVGGFTKVHETRDGVVDAIIAVTGIEDQVGDIIVPGAFRKTLATRMPKGVDAHAWDTPTSKPLSLKELMPGDPDLPKKTARGEPWPRAAGALMVKSQFNLKTQAGSDAYENVRFFEEEAEWSIGYNVPRGGSRIDHKKGIRFLDALDLFEYSTVLFGAMGLAGTLSVKSLGGMIVGGTVEVKALPGSYEARTSMIEKAVSAALLTSPEDWVNIRATFDDHAIACHYPGGIQGHSNRQEWEIPYTIIGDEVTLGEPKPVKIVEQVEPDDAPTDTITPDESAMENKAPETAYLSPSELAATASLRDHLN